MVLGDTKATKTWDWIRKKELQRSDRHSASTLTETGIGQDWREGWWWDHCWKAKNPNLKCEKTKIKVWCAQYTKDSQKQQAESYWNE